MQRMVFKKYMLPFSRVEFKIIPKLTTCIMLKIIVLCFN